MVYPSNAAFVMDFIDHCPWPFAALHMFWVIGRNTSTINRQSTKFIVAAQSCNSPSFQSGSDQAQ